MATELWGLWLGIKLARELLLSSVTFELHSHIVVNLVHKGSTTIASLMLNPSFFCASRIGILMLFIPIDKQIVVLIFN